MEREARKKGNGRMVSGAEGDDDDEDNIKRSNAGMSNSKGDSDDEDFIVLREIDPDNLTREQAY